MASTAPLLIEGRGKVLITGAEGFIGKALYQLLGGRGTRALRRQSQAPQAGDIVIGNIDANTRWQGVLDDYDSVVHLAAHSSSPARLGESQLGDFFSVNVDGTLRLAQFAAESGVRRFVLMSSVKVNGESTTQHPFTELDLPCALGAYAQSKLESEVVLRDIAARTGMEWVILRPPLVFGPGVKGNLLALLKAIDFCIPLPFATLDNRRSLINVTNLAEAVVACIDQSEASNNVFLLREDTDISTRDLITQLSSALGRPNLLFPFPPKMLEHLLDKMNQRPLSRSITSSLTVDDQKIRRLLNWSPSVPLARGLWDMGRWFKGVN
jgi:nucleoside-diphosphate-sugar epimerase